MSESESHYVCADRMKAVEAMAPCPHCESTRTVVRSIIDTVIEHGSVEAATNFHLAALREGSKT